MCFGKRQNIVRSGLGRRVILEEVKIVVERRRGRDERVVRVVVVFSLVRLRPMNVDLELLARMPKLRRETYPAVAVGFGVVSDTHTLR